MMGAATEKARLPKHIYIYVMSYCVHAQHLDAMLCEVIAFNRRTINHIPQKRSLHHTKFKVAIYSHIFPHTSMSVDALMRLLPAFDIIYCVHSHTSV